MDWLTFFSTIIGSIIWPVVIIILVIILKKPISDLIPLLKKLKYKDFEAEFSKDVAELRHIVKREIPQPLPLPAGSTDQTVEKLTQLADLSPRSVVLESWRDVESSAFDATQRKELKITTTLHPSPVAIGRALADAEIINENTLEIFNMLRNMRNKAVHADDFSMDKDDALEYADMANKISIFLRST
jgi:hypothetical protein